MVIAPVGWVEVQVVPGEKGLNPASTRGRRKMGPRYTSTPTPPFSHSSSSALEGPARVAFRLLPLSSE